MGVAKKLVRASAISLLLVFGAIFFFLYSNHAVAASPDGEEILLERAAIIEDHNKSEDERRLQVDSCDTPEEQGDDMPYGDQPYGDEPYVAETSTIVDEQVDPIDDLESFPDGEEMHSEDFTAVEVSTFSELSRAISDSATDYIKLANDITLTSQITIPTNKRFLTIDGDNHNVIQGSSSANFYSRAASDAYYVLKNMSILGRSHYGVLQSTSGPTVEIHNVRYEGPQMIYNTAGKYVFTGTNYVEIDYVANGNSAQEFAEVHALEIHDTFELVSKSTSDSFIWFYGKSGSNPSLTIKNDATARITSTVKKASSRGLFWTQSFPDITVEQRASFVIDIGGSNVVCSTTDHRINTITIMEDATFEVNAGGGIFIAHSFTVSKGSKVLLNYATEPGSSSVRDRNYPLIWFAAAAIDQPFVIDNPKYLALLVESANQSFFKFQNQRTVHINTSEIHYWSNYTNAKNQEIPSDAWQAEAGSSHLEATLTFGSGTDNHLSTSSSSSEFSSSGFRMGNARVFQVGTHPFPCEISDIWQGSTEISGITNPHTRVFLEYRAEGALFTQDVYANSDGFFRFETKQLDQDADIRLVAVIPFIATSMQPDVMRALHPMADAVTTLVFAGDELTENAFELLTNIAPNAPGNLTAEIINYEEMDTSSIGPYMALVAIRNSAELESIIRVPVFVFDNDIVIDEGKSLALRALDASMELEDYRTLEDIDDALITVCFVQAWDIEKAEELDRQRISVADTTGISDEEGDYTITFSATLNDASVSSVALFSIYDTRSWINVRVPKQILFGTLDVIDAGQIMSPTYEIENYSDRPVSVYLSAFKELTSSGIELLSSGEGIRGNEEMKLTLNVDEASVVEYLAEIDQDEGAMQKVMTLSAADDSERAISKVSFGGTYFGSFNSLLCPIYELNWHFSASYDVR